MKDLGNGLYIFTREELIAEQLGWDDEDKGKDLDFTTSLFWLVISHFWLVKDCGLQPQGFNTEKELMQYLSDNEIIIFLLSNNKQGKK